MQINGLWIWCVVWLATLLVVVEGKSKNNPYYIHSLNGGATHYLVYHHEFAGTFAEAKDRCESIPGGKMANVPDERTLTYLGQKIQRESYIGSWNGTVYDKSCIAIFPGDVIAGKGYPLRETFPLGV